MAARHSTRRFPKIEGKALAGIAAFAVFLMLGFRIWSVNQSQLNIPEQHFSMQTDVELAGDFIFDNQENTAGYSVRVDAAELMDASDYIKRYGHVAAGDRDASDVENGDVLVLTYTVTNRDNQSGWLDMVMLMAVGSSKNSLYKVDGNLWKIAEPSLENTSALILTPNSTYTTHVPMSFSTGPDLYESTLDEQTYRRSSIRDRSFLLYVSNAPTRKVIEIQL